MRTLHLNFPHPEPWSAIGLESTMPSLQTTLAPILHVCKRFEFGKFIRLVQKESNQTLGGRRTVSKANLYLVPLLQISRPFEPFRFCASKFERSQGNRFRDVSDSNRSASLPVHRCKPHDQRVPVAKIIKYFSIGMSAGYGRRLYPNGIVSTFRNTFRPAQGQEAQMTTTKITSVQIRVRGFRNETVAIDLKKLGQTLGLFSLEIEWGLLGVKFAPRLIAEVCSADDRLLCRREIFFQQQS